MKYSLKIAFISFLAILPFININAYSLDSIEPGRPFSVSQNKVSLDITNIDSYRMEKYKSSVTISTSPKASSGIDYVLYCVNNGQYYVMGRLEVNDGKLNTMLFTSNDEYKECVIEGYSGNRAWKKPSGEPKTYYQGEILEASTEIPFAFTIGKALTKKISNNTTTFSAQRVNKLCTAGTSMQYPQCISLSLSIPVSAQNTYSLYCKQGGREYTLGRLNFVDKNTLAYIEKGSNAALNEECKIKAFSGREINIYEAETFEGESTYFSMKYNPNSKMETSEKKTTFSSFQQNPSTLQETTFPSVQQRPSTLQERRALLLSHLKARKSRTQEKQPRLTRTTSSSKNTYSSSSKQKMSFIDVLRMLRLR
jgi:hypothetical protein